MSIKKYLAFIMALAYIAAGTNHFIDPVFYIKIMPPYLPFHSQLVFLSGVCEIVFGALIIPLKTRRLAAWAIIALLIAVFPANIQMTINYYNAHDPLLWVTIVRLPLQFVLIYWAWIYTKHPEKTLRKEK